MLELLMVVAVIAVLASLILAAVGGASRTARVAAVKSEIAQLDAAIAKFTADHGIEPPSSIILYELGTDWNGTGTDTVNSRAIIRQLWPQFDFTKNRDLDNSGTTTQSFRLTPSECLVLFLGGMYTSTTTNGKTVFSMIGFSKDPTDPFAPAVAGASREAPLFEFQTARLIDTEKNGIPEYKDSIPNQTAPYLYYSSYGGQGYNSSELVPGNPPTAPINYGLTLIYTQDTSSTAAPWKNNSHQIISPGTDTIYGYGGAYTPTGSDRLPPGTSGTPTAAQRIAEADNITNFSDGVLQH